MAVQLGSDHYLYLAFTHTEGAGVPAIVLKTIDTLVYTDGEEVGPGEISATDIIANLNLVDCIKDVNIGGSNNTVDTTCRESARQGFSTSKITTSDATMSIQMQYDPRTSLTTGNNDAMDALLYAFTTKQALFGIDLDQQLITSTDNGAAGLGGNWSIGFSMPKEVQGQVVCDFEFALESKAQWLVYNGTKFHAISGTNPSP